MKTWNTPAIEELAINQTAGGGFSFIKKDGVSYTTNLPDGRAVEINEYAPLSGEEAANSSSTEA